MKLKVFTFCCVMALGSDQVMFAPQRGGSKVTDPLSDSTDSFVSVAIPPSIAARTLQFSGIRSLQTSTYVPIPMHSTTLGDNKQYIDFKPYVIDIRNELAVSTSSTMKIAPFIFNNSILLGTIQDKCLCLIINGKSSLLRLAREIVDFKFLPFCDGQLHTFSVMLQLKDLGFRAIKIDPFREQMIEWTDCTSEFSAEMVNAESTNLLLQSLSCVPRLGGRDHCNFFHKRESPLHAFTAGTLVNDGVFSRVRYEPELRVHRPKISTFLEACFARIKTSGVITGIAKLADGAWCGLTTDKKCFFKVMPQNAERLNAMIQINVQPAMNDDVQQSTIKCAAFLECCCSNAILGIRDVIFVARSNSSIDAHRVLILYDRAAYIYSVSLRAGAETSEAGCFAKIAITEHSLGHEIQSMKLSPDVRFLTVVHSDCSMVRVIDLEDFCNRVEVDEKPCIVTCNFPKIAQSSNDFGITTIDGQQLVLTCLSASKIYVYPLVAT